MKKFISLSLCSLITFFCSSSLVFAQYIPNITDAHRYDLHFSHPLNEESISPDSHGRLDYSFSNLGNKASESDINFEFEYALTPAFSISASLPYAILNRPGISSVSHTDNIELSLKFANYTFADHHLLLGYGSSIELPTGSDAKNIGSSHMLGISPYFNIGYMYRKWEWTGFATFDIPTHIHQSLCSCTNEFNLQFATLYHVSQSLQGIFEAQRISNLNGPDNGQSSWYLTEGVKMSVKNSPILVGVGIREPLSNSRDFNSQELVSVFYDL
ncbi:MAG TPA: hypothetical protein VJ991_08150 [Balneolales bacterium]|nr:hypothetical protein [Balneolales bacterium]